MSDVAFSKEMGHAARGDASTAERAHHAIRRRSYRGTVVRSLSLLFRLVWAILLAPWRMLRAIRYSLTTASVAVLLVGIMSLNIVWGYPWTGMFAACMSLLGVGWLVNVLMRPRLRMDFSLPSCTPAGQACSIVAHATNVRKIPAFDFSIGLRAIDEPRRKRRRGSNKLIETSPAALFDIIRPGDCVDHVSSVTFHRRGIQAVPNVVVSTTFPFYLFHHQQVIQPATKIAITPRPLRGDEDASARALLHAMGGWSHRLLAGDALDYTGSREYQAGMPVRRWDFSSWARLGRPIVREYQSPSRQAVRLLVDTALSDQHGVPQGAALMERALSLAATAINDLTGKSLSLQLYLTSELPSREVGQSGRSWTADAESMQIRLAQAAAVESATADERIGEVLLEAADAPTLLITSRKSADFVDDLQGSIDVICVDQDNRVEWLGDQGAKRQDGKARSRTADHGGRREAASSKVQPISIDGSRQ